MNPTEILKKAQEWLKSPFDEKTKEEVKQVIENDPKELADRFYKDLEFGTGGMRGVMGAGTNRINKYTLGKSTQGLSNYLISAFPGKKLKVVIAYDCRNNSQLFAKEVAKVFSANDIQVYLFEELRPTPELSFAVRELRCDAGIVLTASHNPPEYNGYKVYFNDGGQIVPPQDDAIVDEINKVKFDKIRFDAKEDLIQVIGEAIDNKFIEAAVKNATFPDTKGRKQLKIVFTSLHGTSITIMPKAFEKAGFTDVHIVEEQRVPDGNFPTVKSPNPEEPAALKMATDLANKIGADILIGTDPDCDRLGIAVRNNNNELVLLNGNQTFCVLIEFLIKKWKEQNRINGKQFIGSTIVTSQLVNRIGTHYGVNTKLGLTGFKWIAKMIRDAEGKEEFIGGGEESFGMMVGDFVRDKDAISATLLACEIAADAKSKGSSVYDGLLDIYTKLGLYREHLISVVKKGMEGAQEIKQMMVDLRQNPLTEIDGEKVLYLNDYESSVSRNLIKKTKEKIDLPKSDVLIYETENGTRIAARPSGTEPKIKFYISVNSPLQSKSALVQTEEKLNKKIERIVKELSL